MKKIIVLSLATLLIVAAVGNGTWAYFSDSETSQNNTITAGTLDLQVGASDPCTEAINIGPDLQPGNSGTAADWLTTNKGNISGRLRIDISAITNYENTRTEPEQAAGDTTTGSTQGELGDFVEIAIWLDINRSGGWDSGDMYLRSNGTVVSWASGSALPPEAYAYINSYAGVYWDSTAGMPDISGAARLNFLVNYSFPADANDNRAQSDSSVFNITFTLGQ
jgi:spore coat-associated protein N